MSLVRIQPGVPKTAESALLSAVFCGIMCDLKTSAAAKGRDVAAAASAAPQKPANADGGSGRLDHRRSRYGRRCQSVKRAVTGCAALILNASMAASG